MRSATSNYWIIIPCCIAKYTANMNHLKIYKNIPKSQIK